MVVAGTTAAMVLAPVAAASAREIYDTDTYILGESPSYLLDWGYTALGSTRSVVEFRDFAVSAPEVGKTAAFPVDPLGSMMSRIESLRSLVDGWLGDESAAPDTDVLNWLGANIGLLASHQGLSIIPIVDGSVSLRWMDGADDFTAELRSNHEMYLFVDHTATDEIDETVVPWSADKLSAFLDRGILA